MRVNGNFSIDGKSAGSCQERPAASGLGKNYPMLAWHWRQTKIAKHQQKRDRYLCCLLIQVARAVLRNVTYNSDFKFDRCIRWTVKLVDRVSYNKATVALTNNLSGATRLPDLPQEADTTLLKDQQPENLTILWANRDQ